MWPFGRKKKQPAVIPPASPAELDYRVAQLTHCPFCPQSFDNFPMELRLAHIRAHAADKGMSESKFKGRLGA